MCHTELIFVDVYTGEIITLGNSLLTIVENNITFTTEQLRENRHYNATIIASNATSQTRISKWMDN